MSAKEMLNKQFEYNFWANDKIFAQAELVSQEVFFASSIIEGRSLQQLLAHLVRIEMVWRLLAQFGEVEPAQLPSEEQLASIEGIINFSRQEYQETMSFLRELPEQRLPEILQIRRWDGVQIEMSRQDMLLHLLLHSMQHRSEAAVLLTQLGHSPGNLDYLFFVLQ